MNSFDIFRKLCIIKTQSGMDSDFITVAQLKHRLLDYGVTDNLRGWHKFSFNTDFRWRGCWRSDFWRPRLWDSTSGIQRQTLLQEMPDLVVMEGVTEAIGGPDGADSSGHLIWNLKNRLWDGYSRRCSCFDSTPGRLNSFWPNLSSSPDNF